MRSALPCPYADAAANAVAAATHQHFKPLDVPLMPISPLVLICCRCLCTAHRLAHEDFAAISGVRPTLPGFKEALPAVAVLCEPCEQGKRWLLNTVEGTPHEVNL